VNALVVKIVDPAGAQGGIAPAHAQKQVAINMKSRLPAVARAVKFSA
jgi:hypothetical protein